MNTSLPEDVLLALDEICGLIAGPDLDDRATSEVRARVTSLCDTYVRSRPGRTTALGGGDLAAEPTVAVDRPGPIQEQPKRSMPLGRGYLIELRLGPAGNLSGTHDHGDLVPLGVDTLDGVHVVTCMACDLFLTLALERDG